SGNRQGWTSQRMRQASHADGSLAEGTLTVQSALTGETQVGGKQAFAQVHGLDDEVDPTLETSPGECHQPPTQAPRRARAGDVAHCDIQVALHDVREVGKVAIEPLHHFGRGPFLRSIHRRGAPRAAERVGHVAGHGDGGRAQAGRLAGAFDPGQPVQFAPARPKLASLGVEEAEAEYLAQAGSSIVGRAATDAHDHAPGAGLERPQEQLAGSPRGGSQGISQGGRHEPEPRGRSHLERRSASVAQKSKRGDHRLAERSSDRDRTIRTTRRRNERRNGPLAAVCHRHAVDLGAGINPGQAPRHGLGRLERRQASFELVRGNHHPHRGRPRSSNSSRHAPASPRDDISQHTGRVKSGPTWMIGDQRLTMGKQRSVWQGDGTRGESGRGSGPLRPEVASLAHVAVCEVSSKNLGCWICHRHSPASFERGSGSSKTISWRWIDTSSGASIPIRTALLSIFTTVIRTPFPTRKLCPSFLLSTSMTPSFLSQGRTGACTSRDNRFIDGGELSRLNAKQAAGSTQSPRFVQYY